MSERQKLQTLNTRSGAAYGSALELVKARILPVSKVGQFFAFKDLLHTFTLASLRCSKTLKAFTRFNTEVWCKGLAYVVKLAKENKGIKFLLVRQNLFKETVDDQGMNGNKKTPKDYSGFFNNVYKTESTDVILGRHWHSFWFQSFWSFLENWRTWNLL